MFGGNRRNPQRPNHGQSLGLAVGLIIALLGSSGGAFGQQRPPSVEPGVIERQFQPTPQPRAPGPVEVPPSPAEQPVPAIAPNVRVELKGVDISGATVFGPADFQPLYADLIGHSVALEQIYALAAQITTKYHNAGYFLSQAIVPPQEIAGGFVRIRVVEGYVAHVQIQGEVRGLRSIIEGYGNKIAADRPARERTFERYLLLMNDLPGVTAHATLAPNPTEVGAADLIVEVRHKTESLSASADNRGTKFIGPYEFRGGASLNSLAGLYDRIDVQYIGTPIFDELRYGDLRYTQPIGDEGFRTELFGSLSTTHPRGTLSSQNIHGDARTVSVAGFYPIERSRLENLTLGGGFALQDATTNQLGVRATDDRMRYLSLTGQYDSSDNWAGNNLVYLEMRQGINGLGASNSSDLLSNPGARPDFALAHATVQRQQDLGALLSGLAILAAADGQYAFTKLVVPQQYAFGGEQYGRAYDPAEITGDHGIAAKVEPQYTFAGIPSYVDTLQAYSFYDFGYVARISPVAGTAQTATGAATGAGLRFFAPYFFGDLEVAHALTRGVSDNEGRKETRFFFRLTAKY